MGNIIIICIIIVCVITGVRETVKHFKGQSACCGGTQGMTREKHKLEGKKIGEYTLTISGMKCENCEIRIENAICRSQPGLSARANHKKGKVIISYDREIDREKVKQAIQDAGYRCEDKLQV